jgi:hypothetical protein
LGGADSLWESAMHVELEALKKRLYVDSKVKNIKFFPGSETDASPDDFAREINKFFAEVEGGEKKTDVAADLDE